MKYSEFADYLEKLEETSSRLTLIEILSGLFKEVDEADVDKIVYLLQGRVAPFFALLLAMTLIKSQAIIYFAPFVLPDFFIIPFFTRAFSSFKTVSSETIGNNVLNTWFCI